MKRIVILDTNCCLKRCSITGQTSGRFNQCCLNYLDYESSAQYIRDQIKNYTEIIPKLPHSFSGTLLAHMDMNNYTIDMLEERSLISERTIRRMKSEENYSSSLYTILALCIGLDLPPVFSFDLLRKGGYTFKCTYEHLNYIMILFLHYNQTIYECNNILRINKVTTLGNKNF